MLIIRTPFRLPLGGGSTDLPSYYSRYGGFVFGVAVRLYFDVFLRVPVTDRRTHFQYTLYEVVDSFEELKHNVGREAIRLTGLTVPVDITFKADVPAGTGLGSSGACAISLLNALYTFIGSPKEPALLAEDAFRVTEKLGWGDGKQDPYLCALGGFMVLEIDTSGRVVFYRPTILSSTIQAFIDSTLIFYTGVRRDSVPILKSQDNEKVLELKHITKEIGKEILASFEKGDLTHFGRLLDKHWRVKKQMSDQMSNSHLDHLYDRAINAGALGGKLMGAGGGGFFMFYCEGDARDRVRNILTNVGLQEVRYGIDTVGTRVLLNTF